MEQIKGWLQGPTREEVLGPFYPHYVQLKRAEEKKWELGQKFFSPIVDDLAGHVESLIGENVVFEYHPPEIVDCGDTVGSSSHFFALRLQRSSRAMSWLGRILRRRTVLLLALHDPSGYPNQWARVAVNCFVRKDFRNILRKEALAHLRQHIAIAPDHFEAEVGFFWNNFGLINYCSRETRSLGW